MSASNKNTIISKNNNSNSNNNNNNNNNKDSNYKVRLLLFRHAESEANILPGVIGGQTNHVDITGLGVSQAKLLGERLKLENINFDFIYTSTAKRTIRTASEALQQAKISFKSTPENQTDLILEQSQGDWEGKSRIEYYTESVLQEMADQHMNFSAPNGESLYFVQQRALQFLLPLIEKAKKLSCEENRIACIGIFTHGGTIRTLIQYFMHSEPRLTWLISNENTAINEFIIDTRGAVCSRINDAGHLYLLSKPELLEGKRVISEESKRESEPALTTNARSS